MYKNQIASLYVDPKQVFSKDTLYKAAKTILSEKFEKGFINEDNFNKAMQELDVLEDKQNTITISPSNEIEKGGEGSKGGKVIGHTRSGKPVYQQKYATEYHDFDHHEHLDAASVHHQDAHEREKNEGTIGRHESNKRRDSHITEHEKGSAKVDHAEKVKEHTKHFVDAKLKGDKKLEAYHRGRVAHHTAEMDKK